MSTTTVYTPGFMRMVNVRLGEPLSPLVTGQLVPGGQIQTGARERREIVLDRERERSHYFDGKLLKARDLLRDQNYLDARLRQAGRAFGSGIVDGLQAGLNNGWISIQPGVAVSPSGRVLELRDHVLRAPVDDAALRAALNQGRYGYLSSGLYLLLLSWHEQTSDAIAEVYPRQAGERPAPQPDAYEEGVRLELMASPEPLPMSDDLDARAALAERYLASGVELPGLPAESIALGLLAVRDNQPQWLDGPLVRRDYRREREPHAARLRLAEHHDELLADLVRERHRNEAFELSRYFRRIPAFGPLPNAMVDVRNQSFTGFPDHYELDLVPVRAEDIGFVREQAAHLPPLNLTDTKVERVQILVPLDSAAYETLTAALDAEAAGAARATLGESGIGAPLRLELAQPRLPSTLSRRAGIAELARSPFDRLSASRLRFPGLIRLPARPAWEVAFASLPPGPIGLYYVREFQLAAIQAPQVLPISAGFPQPTQPAEGPVDEAPEPPDDGPVDEPDTPIEQPAPGRGIDAIIEARGSRHPETFDAIDKLRPVIRDNADLFGTLLSQLDNAYDRFLWPTLVLSSSPVELAKGLAQGLLRGAQPAKIVDSIGSNLNLPTELRERWLKLADLLGDGGGR